VKKDAKEREKRPDIQDKALGKILKGMKNTLGKDKETGIMFKDEFWLGRGYKCTAGDRFRTPGWAKGSFRALSLKVNDC